MADYKAIFKSKENQNWTKCCFAIRITRLGLLESCKSKVGQFHSRIIAKLPPGTVTKCTNCSESDVIPYSKPGHRCRRGQCRCPSKRCPLRVCDTLKTEIEKEHLYNQISWKNTNIGEWLPSSWEVAKCFFPVDGYKTKKTAEETDFNGLISLMMNCKIFERASSLPNFQITWDRARKLIKDVRHSSDLVISDTATNDVINALTYVISDKSLDGDRKVVDVRSSLNQLKSVTLTITDEEILSVVREAYEQTQQQLRDDVDKLHVKTSDLQQKLDLLAEITNDFISPDRKVDILAERARKRDDCLARDTGDQYEDLKAGYKKEETFLGLRTSHRHQGKRRKKSCHE